MTALASVQTAADGVIPASLVGLAVLAVLLLVAVFSLPALLRAWDRDIDRYVTEALPPVETATPAMPSGVAPILHEGTSPHAHH